MKHTTANLLKATLAGMALCSFTACSKGFQSATGSSTTSSGNNNGQTVGGGTGTPSNPSAPAPIDTVDMKGYSNGGETEGKLLIDFDKTDKVFIISVPITLAGLGLNVNVSHPKYPDIQFYNYTDDAGVNRLNVRVPAKYLVTNLTIGSATTLPNGQVIPMSGGSSLPASTIDLNVSSSSKTKATLFIGNGVLALYVSHPMVPEYASLYYQIRNKAKTSVIGSIGIAAKTSLGDGGFVVAMKLPTKFATIIEDYLASNN